VSNMCGCPPPPHAPTEIATWPAISAAVPIPDSAYDFTSNPGEVFDSCFPNAFRDSPSLAGLPNSTAYTVSGLV
jgi:hypothetical protein